MNCDVIVTGAAGWLGLGLVNALVNGLPECEALRAPRKNLKIRCLIRPGEDAARLRRIAPEAEIFEGDVTRPESLAPLWAEAEDALLYHCCGVIHPARVREFMRVNADGAANAFRGAARAKVRRAVVMSSNSPCGANPHPDHLFDEHSPYSPYMGYGRSKMVMETTLRELAAKSGAPELVIIRAPWFYGPFQPDRQTEFFRMIRKGRGPLVGGGRNLRSMAYIDNLAQGMLLAGEKPQAAGETFWIADARPYAMREIVDTVEKVLREDFGVPCKGGRLRLPSFVADAARGADFLLQAAGFYDARVHVLSEMNQTIACSTDKAAKMLDYRPTVGLREGMRRSVASMLADEKQARAFLGGRKEGKA